MRYWLFVALVAGVEGQPCVVTSDSRTFDFSQLTGKQITSEDPTYKVDFTFCQKGTDLCGGEDASICQTDKSFPAQVVLGVWGTYINTSATDGELKLVFKGEFCSPKGADRVTTITLKCSGSSTVFKSFDEPSTCVYEGVIYVPASVCAQQQCCTPPTYSMKKLAGTGTELVVAVVQQDTETGDFYDGSGPALQKLCSKYYNRCFSFNDTYCVGSTYVPPPAPECVGSPWESLGEYPLVEQTGPLQTVWTSSGNYVITASLGEGCVILSGSGRAPTFNWSLTPDAGLWEVPEICLKGKSRF